MVTPTRDAAHLVMRLSCFDVVRASFRLIDDGRAGATAELYAEGATLVRHGEGELRLRGDAIGQAMRQREQLDRRTVHVVTPSSFRRLDTDRAECESHLQVYDLSDDPAAPPTPTLLSRVHDELVSRPDGSWLITARRITVLAGRR
jgi:hypothetical protein